MRITSHGTYAALAISLSCALFLVPNDVEACRFTIQHTIKFEQHESSISNSDRIDLAKTLIDVRNSVARGGMVVIYGYSEEGRGTAITKKRVESVTQYLRALGVAEDRINIDYEIWHVASNVPDSERFQIMIEFLPGRGENFC